MGLTRIEFAVAVFLFLLAAGFEWRNIAKELKRERVAYLSISTTALIVAMFITLMPRSPGPTQWYEFMMKAFSRFLEVNFD